MCFFWGLKTKVWRGLKYGFLYAKASLLREILTVWAKDILLCLSKALKEATMRNLVTDFGYLLAAGLDWCYRTQIEFLSLAVVVLVFLAAKNEQICANCWLGATCEGFKHILKVLAFPFTPDLSKLLLEANLVCSESLLHLIAECVRRWDFDL